MRCIMPHTTMAIHESMNTAPTDRDAPVPFIRRRPVRLTIYAGLGLFAFLMVIWPLIAQLKDPDFQKHIAEHRVMVGMSKEQVLQAWEDHKRSTRRSPKKASVARNGFLKIGKAPRW